MKKVRNLQKLIPLLPLLLLAILFIFLPIISMIQKSFLSPETGAFTLNNSGKILYLIFDYPHKYNTFKHFDV